jgi:hypothetical protein
MFEPFTLAATIAMGLFKWTLRKERNDAVGACQSAYGSYARAHLKLTENVEKMGTDLSVLGEERLSSVRWLVPRAVSVAKRLEDPFDPFDPNNGWFGQKGCDQIDELVEFARNPHVIEKTLLNRGFKLSLGGIMLLQGIDTAHSQGWIHIDLLDKNLSDLMRGLPLDDAAVFADQLHFLDGLSVADALSGVLAIYSVFRIVDYTTTARSAREAAEQAKAAEAHARDATEHSIWVRRRAQSISRELMPAAYELFKTTWYAEQVLRARNVNRRRVSRAAATRVFTRFENSVRKFWCVLEKPIWPDEEIFKRVAASLPGEPQPQPQTASPMPSWWTRINSLGQQSVFAQLDDLHQLTEELGRARELHYRQRTAIARVNNELRQLAGFDDDDKTPNVIRKVMGFLGQWRTMRSKVYVN